LYYAIIDCLERLERVRSRERYVEREIPGPTPGPGSILESCYGSIKMKDRMTESDVSFEEKSLDEEAGGPGSLNVSEVTELRNLRKGGLSYRDIAEFAKRPVSTVFKWTHMVTPEAFFEPGVSLQEKLSRHFGRPIVWPSPSETKPSKNSQVARTTSEPTRAAQADDNQRVNTRTVQVFDATLSVTRTRLGIVPFSVPGGVLKPATINFTAAGSPFDVHLLFSEYQLSHFGRPYNPPMVRVGGDEYYWPYMWKSQVVTRISQQLPMNIAGQWYLVFQNAPELSGDNSIRVVAALTTKSIAS